MTFELPKLEYDMTALEPMIDGTTMEIHYGKHHQAYVDKLNEAVAQFEMGTMTLSEMLSDLSRVPEKQRMAVRNHGGGHYNHSLFWEVMGVRLGENPRGVFGEAMNQVYGSYEGFKEKFTEAAMGRFGSGWAWLGVDEDKKLVISSTPNQDNPLMKGVVDQYFMPILGLDVWEHAYYLQYQNRRAEYVMAWYEVVNWPKIGKRYEMVVEKQGRLPD